MVSYWSIYPGYKYWPYLYSFYTGTPGSGLVINATEFVIVKEKKLISNSNNLRSLFIQPDGDISNIIFYIAEFLVYKIKDLRHQVAKIQRL